MLPFCADWRRWCPRSGPWPQTLLGRRRRQHCRCSRGHWHAGLAPPGTRWAPLRWRLPLRTAGPRGAQRRLGSCCLACVASGSRRSSLPAAVAAPARAMALVMTSAAAVAAAAAVVVTEPGRGGSLLPTPPMAMRRHRQWLAHPPTGAAPTGQPWLPLLALLAAQMTAATFSFLTERSTACTRLGCHRRRGGCRHLEGGGCCRHCRDAPARGARWVLTEDGAGRRPGRVGAFFFVFFFFLPACFRVTLCPRSRQRAVWLLCDAVSSVAAEVAPEAANRYQPCTNGALAETLQFVVCRLEQRTEGERVFCQCTRPPWSSPG